MPPTDPRRRSGEHMAASEGVPVGTFYNFMDEFRTFAQNTDTKLDKIKTELAEGSTRFALYEQKAIEATKRGDEHSDQIEVLRIDKIEREAQEKQKEKDSSPRNELLRDVVKAVVIAAVLGTCAILYNVVRDHEIDMVAKSQIPKSNDNAPTNPAP